MTRFFSMSEPGAGQRGAAAARTPRAPAAGPLAGAGEAAASSQADDVIDKKEKKATEHSHRTFTQKILTELPH